MSTPVLLIDQSGPVRTLTLNRPDRRNALSPELVDALVGAFDDASSDPSTTTVVLTGAGDQAFCSGADLDPSAALGKGPLGLHESRHRFVDLMQAMRRSRVPIVGRVAGHVAAGGMGLVAACDIVVAADDVHFSTPEIKVGLFPMMIMSVLLRSVGRKRLMELLLTGDRVDARTAVEMGLVNHAVPRAELDARVAELVDKVSGYSPAVLALGRQAFHAMEDMPLDQALEYLCGQLTLNTLTEDAAEGVSAFVTRRKPEWKGR